MTNSKIRDRLIIHSKSSTLSGLVVARSFRELFILSHEMQAHLCFYLVFRKAKMKTHVTRLKDLPFLGKSWYFPKAKAIVIDTNYNVWKIKHSPKETSGQPSNNL